MKLLDIAPPSARFFLKSEYGPLSAAWPVVAFSHQSFETQIRREYTVGRDFILYLGTLGEETTDPADRGGLLSVAEIDTTRVFNTYDHISASSRVWAEREYPGRWLRSFRVIRGFDITSRPKAADLLAHTNRNMWHVPFREVVDEDRSLLLDLEIDLLRDIDILQQSNRELEPMDLLRPENRLQAQEALRLANLVFNRVLMSGQVIHHRAPERSAPTSLQLQILALLLRKPLDCGLCGGPMSVPPVNKLFKISGDRKDSANGDYGPDNYQLVHLACNLAKNDASASDFVDWLKMVRRVDKQETESIYAE